MASRWKKFLLIFILAGIFYAGCNRETILATESLFRKELPRLSATSKVCYFLANVSYYTFRPALAQAIIERNLKDFPYERGVIDAEYKRARCCDNMGDCDRAIKLYTKFLLDHPRDNRYRKIKNRIAKLQAFNRNK